MYMYAYKDDEKNVNIKPLCETQQKGRESRLDNLSSIC